jgi:Family of unknown function (DUF5706)
MQSQTTTTPESVLEQTQRLDINEESASSAPAAVPLPLENAAEQVAYAEAYFTQAFAEMKSEQVEAFIAGLKEQLDRDQSWIRHFDFKLGPVLASDAALIGVVIKLFSDSFGMYFNSVSSRPFGDSVLLGGTMLILGLLTASVIYGILAISPKLSWKEVLFWKFSRRPLSTDGVPATQFFFSHIASHPSFQNLTEEILITYNTPARQAAQLLQQVRANAKVTEDKALQVRWSIKLLFLGILLALTTIAGTAILWSLGL